VGGDAPRDLRRGVFAATGQLSLAGYEVLEARAAACLDAMTEGALRQLAMEREP
jgi:hypothetical protein